MKKTFDLIVNWLKQHLPLLAVVAVALIMACQNIDPTTFYSGWDNVHPEFDLKRYAQQVFFGTWLEHQNLGAPMSLAHLSEITRLPILFALEALLPMNLSRYAFIFLMYLIGGVGMYLYLSKAWLHQQQHTLSNWLASLGGIFYLLHILTLQQYYIAFEIYTVQFAFLPFLLLAVHHLAKKIDAKSLLIFIGLQLLIAPSGHTPTVFYLAVIFSILYGFMLLVKKDLLKAIRFGWLIGALTLAANAYWILPNLYYSLHESHYVEESHDNLMFGPESLQSIKDAGTPSNFLMNTQYLFGWKDYSFETKEFEYIFNEWQPHLDQLPVKVLLTVLGGLTVLGVFSAALDKRRGAQRWAVISIYLLCLALTWIELFPTKMIVDQLYQSKTFLEAFRNSFTKLQVIYAFVSVVLFIQMIEMIVLRFKNKRAAGAGILVAALAIILVAWPSFQGHFLSEKLKVEYPVQYWQLFDYLTTRDSNLRLLQLPQLSHAGWEYYDWQWLGAGNGYQGMGFYMFGFPQPFANRDSDRWVETSDFFYFELKSALDTQDVGRFAMLLEKYNLDLLIVDETKIDPNVSHDFAADHQLALAAGLTKVWQLDFLTIYERESDGAKQPLIVPEKITLAAGDTKRVRTDYLFQNEGEYALVGAPQASVVYPFNGLTAHQLKTMTVNEDSTKVAQTVSEGSYTLTLPAAAAEEYFAPAAVYFKDRLATISFPTVTLRAGEKTVVLPKLADVRLNLPRDFETIIVFFNDVGVIVKQGEASYPVLRLTTGQSVSVEYAPKPAELVYLDSGAVDASQLSTTVAVVFTPDWESLQQDISFETGSIQELTITSQFPVVVLDPLANDSRNCAVPSRGTIHTAAASQGASYRAESFGVNCTGYGFPSHSPAYSYILKVAGENKQGRGMKFFINFPNQAAVAEDYLMAGQSWQALLTLDQLSTDPTASFEVNWETRSFGKTSINELHSMQITPFPLRQMAQLKLERVGAAEPMVNELRVVSDKLYLGTVHVVEVECAQASCFLGLDQSYDDAWLAVKTDQFGLLPHLRLNTWANLWQVEGSGQVIIFYLPELVSLLSLGGLVIGVLILLQKLA